MHTYWISKLTSLFLRARSLHWNKELNWMEINLLILLIVKKGKETYQKLPWTQAAPWRLCRRCCPKVRGVRLVRTGRSAPCVRWRPEPRGGPRSRCCPVARPVRRVRATPAALGGRRSRSTPAGREDPEYHAPPAHPGNRWTRAGRCNLGYLMGRNRGEKNDGVRWILCVYWDIYELLIYG